MLRVLSIDGGGIRGIIPATVLAELERLTSRSTFELFDYVAGTSTGGILALALLCPQANGRPNSAVEVRKLYLEHGVEIFPLGGEPLFGKPSLFGPGTRTALPEDATARQRFERVMGFEGIRKTFAWGGGDKAQGNASYPAAPLERLLAAELGETLMSRALRPVAAVSCDLDTGAPLVFRGGGLAPGPLGDTQMRNVARATSAGPTFFQPLIYEDPQQRVHRCVDGGLIANDPAFVAYTDSLRMLANARGDPSDILLVSLGTGAPPNGATPEAEDVPRLVDRRTWLGLGTSLLPKLAIGSGELTRQQMTVALGDAYVRIQTTVGFGAVHAMDNVQPANLQGLLQTAEALVRTSSGLLQSLAEILAST